MTVTLGATSIGAVYLGATPAEKVYLGSELVWSAGPLPAPNLTTETGDDITTETGDNITTEGT